MYKRDIYLDIDDNLNNYIKSVELDSNSRVWHFHLTVDYEPLDLTGKSVQFRAEKPDKTNVLNDCKIVDAEKGVVEVKLTRQVNAIPGHVKCLLKIVGAEGFVLKTKTFVVDVSKTLSDDAIVSSDEFGALEAALGKVQDIDNRFAQTNAQLSEKANKNEIANGLTAKGSCLYASLPTTNNLVGDYYYCTDGDGVNPAGNYVWNGTSWYFGGTGDNGYGVLKNDLTQLSDNLENRVYCDNKKLIVYNYVDENKFEVGSVTSNGDKFEAGSAANFKRTIDYLPVNPNSTLSGWRDSGTPTDIHCYYYDSSKKFISSTNQPTSQVPSNAKFMILVLSAKYFGGTRNLMVKEGTTWDEYIAPTPSYEYVQLGKKFVDEDDYSKAMEHLKSEVESLKGAVDENEKTETSVVKAFIHDVMYCAVGTTIDIYNNQVCINADRYRFQWLCDVGLCDKRKFTVTGQSSNVGEHDLTLNIYNDSLGLVWTKTLKLKIVNILNGSYSLGTIGDSMTYGGGQWHSELQTNLSKDKIQLVGTMSKNFRGVDYHIEGRNGYTASDYAYTSGKNGLGNPFYNPSTNKFDFSYYRLQNSINMDAIMIELGTNNIQLDSTENVAAIKTMVDNIRSVDENIKIYICNAIYRSGQDGICRQLNSQGYSLSKGNFKYEEDMKVLNLMIALDETFKNYQNLHFIPLALCHDSENNFGHQSVPLNSRSKVMIDAPSDSIHPNKDNQPAEEGYDIVGYLQFADVMWSVFCGTL